jgi:hypothetical protein
MKNLIAVLVLSCAVAAAYAESAVTVRSTELQAQAQVDAATLATLPENAKVDVLRRRGAWIEVKTGAGQSGWVRMFNLKLEGSGGAQDAASGSANPLGALGNLLTSGRTSNTATTTTGVRGLTKEDVQNAQANPGEFKKLQGYSVNKSAGQSFAQRSKLAPAKLEYLADPAPVRTESTMVGG